MLVSRISSSAVAEVERQEELQGQMPQGQQGQRASRRGGAAAAAAAAGGVLRAGDDEAMAAEDDADYAEAVANTGTVV